MIIFPLLWTSVLILHLGESTSVSTTSKYDNWNSTSFDNQLRSNEMSQSSYWASEASKFSYIIPYGRSQKCDMYGPLCQTGTITVGVNLTTMTATTVLPCSSYLTLQSYYLEAPVAGDLDVQPYDYVRMADNWGVSFGRSPQCKS